MSSTRDERSSAFSSSVSDGRTTKGDSHEGGALLGDDPDGRTKQSPADLHFAAMPLTFPVNSTADSQTAASTTTTTTN